MSISGGLHLALERGHAIGCESIQIFTRNQTRWKSKPRTPEELQQYRQAQLETGIAPVVAHAIYLINLASPDEPVRSKSTAAFEEELARCYQAGIPYLVMHPGSHKGSGLQQGIARIAKGINRAYATHPEYIPSDQGGVMCLLENTAGQGATIGRSFDELAQIAAQIADPSTVGYCFDTAHALAAGYELRTSEGYETLWTQFDTLLGLDKLRCFHLNDSKYDLGERRDRHQHIGEGFVGLDGFRLLVNDPRFTDLPMLLETPKDVDMHQDAENLNRLRTLLA
jgi:deoxyribonuclease-4